MIAGYFGTKQPGGAVLDGLRAQSKANRSVATVVEDEGLWACLYADNRRHIDPVVQLGGVTAVAADPVFVGTLEQGYHRATPGDWGSGFVRKGVTFFQTVVNNVRAAAIDKTPGSRRLHLVSHRLGPGRMYYRPIDGGIAFSSDAKVLARIGSTEPNPMGLWAVIIYGAVPEPLTVLEGIAAVPVGQAATFEIGSAAPSLTPILSLGFPDPLQCDADACLAQAEHALAAGAKLVAELGASMTVSGGIDSSLFLCLMQDAIDRPKRGYFCRFGVSDPEEEYAREVAQASNTDLTVFHLLDSDVIPSICHASESAMHPFSDFSSIAVTFLTRSIARDRPDCPWLFDGNGGDDCFGVGSQELLRWWKMLTALPGPFHRVPAYLWLRLGLWKRYGKLDIVMRKLYQASVSRAHLASFVDGHVGMTSPAESEWLERLGELMQVCCDACIANGGRDLLRADFYMMQLLHVCSRRWTAKILGPAHATGRSVLFPYLWRDVLEATGRIPWRLKVHNGVVKWPLKRFLENHMRPGFIYRPKSGFTPPWRRWLRSDEINGFVRETLLCRSARVTAVLREAWIDRMLTHLRQSAANPPAMILNTIWGALTTEIWLQKVLA